MASVHPACTEDELYAILDIPLNPALPIFSFQVLDGVEVYQTALVYLNKIKGHSGDDLSLYYFKDLLSYFMSIMTKIYNDSLATATYPAIWKRALITPLNKVPNPDSPNDTRPIASIPHLAKVFDKLTASQVMSFLESNNLLSDWQSGFRKSFSTQSALLKITEDIRLGIENGLVTVIVLFDFKKAFDSLMHFILLKCMRELNFSDDAIRWFHSYISGRSQAVIDLFSKVTEFLPLTSGIPQGSNPGPVAFLIFINSIVKSLIYCNSSCMLFADDFQIYLQCKPRDLPDCIARLNVDTNAVASWSSEYHLDLNLKKIKPMIIGSVQNLMRIRVDELPQIMINGSAIPFVKTVKNLGLHLTDDLSWNAHVSQICSRVYGVLNRLRFRAHFLSSNLKKMLVSTLILPHFDYVAAVTCDMSGYLELKLQRLLNTLVRFVFRLRRDAALAPYLAKLNWLPISSRRRYFMGIITYKFLSTSKPSYLASIFPSARADLRRSTRREPSAFHIPLATLATYEYSFSIQAMRFWDSLPVAIRLKPSIEAFKVALYQYLLSL